MAKGAREAGRDDAAEPVASEQLEELVASTDQGARRPAGGVGKWLFALALAWSLFQLYIASPLPFFLGIWLIDDSQQRAIHLAFAFFLAFCAYPAMKGSPRARIPLGDWLLAGISAACALYILVFYVDVASRSGGIRTPVEVAVSVIGIICLLEITRRALGWPLVIVSCVFIVYAFAGPYMPDFISHRGVSLNRFVDHMWLTTEGIFGLPLGVSNSFIFLFVLFGALLEKAGAGNYFIQISFALLGHLRGGPAKAAVVSSGMTGLISGSAIANIVTTGTFTIPLMKRVGFSPEKAAAVEVSSSINGQIMPPVMGAAAFLMTEFVGISYFEVIKHAFLPAVIAYIGLYFIVHLEASKANLAILQKVVRSSRVQRLIAFAVTIGAIIIFSGIVYYGILFLKSIFAGATPYVAAGLLVAVYLALIRLAASQPALELDDPKAPLVHIPDTLPTFLAGLYYLLPVGVLVWCLMIERFSPSYSVSWAIVAMMVLMTTQPVLVGLFRGDGLKGGLWGRAVASGFVSLVEGMVGGARNMVAIGIAMAAAGIIVGVVSQTGVGLLMTEIIDTVSQGNVMLMLLFTALMCVILGMGLPTTANYIVVASIMAQPLVTLAAQNGIIVPLIAVHLFVFYFGLISGTTPPVAVDAFAGAAVARSDPMQTCIQAFFYDLRTSVLPFIFIFNPALLLIGIEHWWSLVITVTAAVTAMLAFGAATQGFLLCRSRRWESAALLLVAFTLFRPGFWLDLAEAPYIPVDPLEVEDFAALQPGNANLRMLVEGENFSGELVSKVVLLPLGADGLEGAERLYEHAGIAVVEQDGIAVVEDVRLNSPAQQWGMDFDWVIHELQVPAERVAKEWFQLPAYGAFLVILLLQLRRRRTGDAEGIGP